MEIWNAAPHEALEPMRYYLCDRTIETTEGHEYVVAGPFEEIAEGVEVKARLGITCALTLVMVCG